MSRSGKLSLPLAAGLAVLGLASLASADARSDPRGQSSVRFIRESAKTVRYELREARISGDPRRVRCVNTKLTQVHAQLRLAEEHAPWVDRPRIDADTRRRHDYVLSTALRRARDLTEEAKLCGVELAPFQLTVIDGDGVRSARARR
jgi:hypothetical protein